MNSAPALPVGSGGLLLATSAAKAGLGGCVLIRTYKHGDGINWWSRLGTPEKC